jgi:hypothetical protein
VYILCIHICLYIFTYVCICIYIYTSIYVYVCTHCHILIYLTKHHHHELSHFVEEARSDLYKVLEEIDTAEKADREILSDFSFPIKKVNIHVYTCICLYAFIYMYMCICIHILIHLFICKYKICKYAYVRT